MGLDEFYDIGGDDVAFFTVHESLDVQHADAERAMISTLVSDETEEESAVRALAGEISIGGRLPVSLGSQFRVGHGLTRPAKSVGP